jgi:5-methylcytosine-specific restriction protein A
MAWARTSRHQRGYGAAWDATRQRILRRDNGLCQECLRKGRIEPGNQVDHIIPRARRGGEGDDNLETLCKPHHDDKTARDSGKQPRPTIGADGWPEA